MKVHEMKTWPISFGEVQRGNKRAEYRRNDRDFEVGDLILLREYVPTREEAGNPSTFIYAAHKPGYTKRTVLVQITHVEEGGPVPEGYAVLSIELVKLVLGGE